MQKSSSSSLPFWITFGVGVTLIIAFLSAMVGMINTRFTAFPADEIWGMGGNRDWSLNDGVAESTPPMMTGGYTQGSPEYGDRNSSGADMYYPGPTPSAGSTAAEAEARVIKTGNFNLDVESATASIDSIKSIADAKGGFVGSSSVIDNPSGEVSGYITISVPSDKFRETMEAIRAVAIRVNSETENSQDVTEQYTDLETRLRSAEAKHAQYLKILEKATKIEDILAVTQYVSQVEYEIESLKGQMKYIENRTDLSTISITLTEEARLKIPAAKFDLGKDVKEAGYAVILLAQALVTFLVWLVIIGGAFLIPTAVIAYIAYRLVRKFVYRT